MRLPRFSIYPRNNLFCASPTTRYMCSGCQQRTSDCSAKSDVPLRLMFQSELAGYSKSIVCPVTQGSHSKSVQRLCAVAMYLGQIGLIETLPKKLTDVMVTGNWEVGPRRLGIGVAPWVVSRAGAGSLEPCRFDCGCRSTAEAMRSDALTPSVRSFGLKFGRAVSWWRGKLAVSSSSCF